MKQITVKQMAAIKRIAMNVAPLTRKKAAAVCKMATLSTEIARLNEQIDAQQGYVKSVSGGLTTEDLITRNEENKYVPSSRVRFDEDKRIYTIVEEDCCDSCEKQDERFANCQKEDNEARKIIEPCIVEEKAETQSVEKEDE